MKIVESKAKRQEDEMKRREEIEAKHREIEENKRRLAEEKKREEQERQLKQKEQEKRKQEEQLHQSRLLLQNNNASNIMGSAIKSTKPLDGKLFLPPNGKTVINSHDSQVFSNSTFNKAKPVVMLNKVRISIFISNLYPS